MSRLSLRILCLAMLSLAVPGAAHAQRRLRWDNIDVSAHLGRAGDLRVTETQTIVFTGLWNGGERRFTIHPRQKLTLLGLYRDDGGAWRKLTEDARLDDVDDYAWINARTLRWRSRRPSEAPFDNSVFRYELRYTLSAVVLPEAGAYRLDHDFAFADRDGTIDRFDLRLTHDPEWQPMSDVRETYTAGPLPPGRSFVLNLPLRHTGPQPPVTLDTRPAEVRIAVAVLLGVTALLVLWFFVREQSYGRFAPLETEQVDEPWLREHILKHPAEVIGAAWDEGIGAPEVVALIARMVGEGKLGSDVGADGDRSSMTLSLKVNRLTLEGHERALVDGLFFDGRIETTTDLVKEHYRGEGFDPVSEIRPGLQASVQRLLPAGDTPRASRIESRLLLIFGGGVLLYAWFLGNIQLLEVLLLGLVALFIAGIGWIAGAVFKNRVQWGRGAALLCLTPAILLAAGTASFLWFATGAGAVVLSAMTLVGIVACALALINTSINALRSRQSRGAIALRKKLVSGREFFIAELRKERPALRDEWYPWALAFGLTPQIDDWSAKRPVSDEYTGHHWSRESRDTSSSPSSAPSTEQWGGAGGGRSGGAGGGASWAAAAGGLAAGVAAPSPSRGGSSDSSDSSSSYSSSSDSSGGGSSGGDSGGSSGGGGGGGW